MCSVDSMSLGVSAIPILGAAMTITAQRDLQQKIVDTFSAVTRLNESARLNPNYDLVNHENACAAHAQTVIATVQEMNSFKYASIAREVLTIAIAILIMVYAPNTAVLACGGTAIVILTGAAGYMGYAIYRNKAELASFREAGFICFISGRTYFFG